MTFSVCFIERRDQESPSIERVFRSIANELETGGVSVRFVKVPFGNGSIGTLLNLLCFRPPTSDLYHVTGHVNYVCLRLPRKKTILTVHDMTVLGLRSGLRRWLIRKLFFVWPVRSVNFLTAISQATKERIVQETGIAPESVQVIENPLLVSESPAHGFNADEPTILQVGTAPNKNIPRLIEAITGMRCKLRIVGRIPISLRHRIDELEIKLTNDDRLDDAGMERAYEDSDIVAFCSTEEGFGLPIIEAQAKRTVVVTSDRSPMKEVAGGGAVLVDPDDVDSIRQGIKMVVQDASLRTKLVETGSANIGRFDPANIAAKYMNLYERALEKL